MASDVAPSPTLFEILLGSSPHYRTIVFSECTVLELARFSCASRAARKMSLNEMGRRKLDVTVRVENVTLMGDMDGWLEKTALVIKDRFGPTAKINGPVAHFHYGILTFPPINGVYINVPNGITVAHRKFATILYCLLAQSRIRNLEFEEEGEQPDYHFITLFLESGLLDDRKKNDEAVSIPENGHAIPLEPFYVENFRVPDNYPCMQLLDVISARRIIVAHSDCDEILQRGPEYNIFSHRGILDAEFVEVEYGDWSWHYAKTALQNLMAPNINVREWITVKEHDVHIIISQWQSGDRTIETFHANIETVNDDDGKEGFAIMHSTANSSKLPYPSEDVIPRSVRLQMKESEKYYESTDDKVPRAFLIGRVRDDCRLVVLTKFVKTGRMAVGIYQKQ